MARPLSRRRFLRGTLGATALAPVAAACGSSRDRSPPAPEPPAQPPEPGDDSVRGLVVASTWRWGRAVCDRALATVRRGGDLLDALEQGIGVVERDPEVLTVGYGGLPNEAGVVQLDAMIMRGSDLQAGAVGCLEGIATPIAVARKVMERTRHVYLVGAGARAFAEAHGFEARDLSTLESRRRWEAWRASGERRFRREEHHDTVGAVAIDGRGEVAAGLSTSGLAFKMPGRVGDSPLVGAGGYADSDVGAACATGVGEEVIRTVGTFAVVEAMRAGQTPSEAAASVLRRLVRKRGDALGDAQVAYIALRRDGEVGAACLRPGFELAVLRRGELEMRSVAPLS